MSMPFWSSCATPALLNKISAWQSRWLTVQAMALLCFARLLVAFVPLRMWRNTIGQDGPKQCVLPEPDNVAPAKRLAGRVERAATRLPFETKCLPRAMALAWMLRIRGFSYTFKLAARPMQARSGKDDLHAWVEKDGTLLVRGVAGPWIVVLTLTRCRQKALSPHLHK